jgi:hypothetical protein
MKVVMRSRRIYDLEPGSNILTKEVTTPEGPKWMLSILTHEDVVLLDLKDVDHIESGWDNR